MSRVVAILETMWDWRKMTSDAGYLQAPRYFRINPQNHSGRRLYKLIGGPQGRLLVTNACRELATSAKGHGKTDPVWLAENLSLLDGATLQAEGGRISGKPFDVLLVCGKVAQKCYRECGFTPAKAKVIEIPHPAARAYWTSQTIAETGQKIQEAMADGR